MFVARRAFRNYNQMVLPGSIVEPDNIKWFKTRLKDRVIIEVTPHTLDTWNEYFEQKFSVSIKPKEAEKSAVTEEPKAPAKAVAVKATIK